MSVFALKIVATICMFLDHFGIVANAWGSINYSSYCLLRGIGRIAFPIYSYLIVNGFFKSHNVNRYMSNLLMFAIIAQMPFTLALYPVNLMPIDQNEIISLFHFTGSIGIIIFLTLGYWYLNKTKDNFFLLPLALVFSSISLKIGHVWFLSSGNLNVFFTLTLGLLTIVGIHRIFNWNICRKKKILIVFLLGLGYRYILGRSDYGIAGVILITGIFLVRKKILQMIYICVWATVFYGLINQNIYNALWSCSSVLLILLYNGKKGISMKYFFYLLYPIHLILGGIINIYLRLLAYI